jgi:DNA-binding transcriptional ArsR family regulator
MIYIKISEIDLSKLRFAYRPLLEIPMSYRILINPMFQSRYHDWIESTKRDLHDLNLMYLADLVAPCGYIPDFMTPTPTSRLTEIEDDFQSLLLTPDEIIQEGIFELIENHGDTEIRRFFLTHPRAAIQCLVEEMEIYWKRVLQDHWNRMLSLLENELLYRGRQLALNGYHSLFEDLHPTIDYHKNELQIRGVCDFTSADHYCSLEDNGLYLVPMIFAGCGRCYQVKPNWDSMLGYRTRGLGLWHEKPASNLALEQALGEARAKVFLGVTEPCSNAELAFRMQISSSTANEHLMRLKAAGLVECYRSGKRVYYQLSARGLKLLDLFENGD